MFAFEIHDIEMEFSAEVFNWNREKRKEERPAKK